MNTSTPSLTHGPLGRQIFRFSVPLMLSNLLQVLFNMADIAIAGRFAGAEALGAVGSTSILVTLFVGFLIGVGSGVNVVVAWFLGAQQHQDVSESVHTAAILSALIGLLLLGLGVSFARPLLELLGTKDVLIDGAALYLRIYFLGMPALALYNYGHAVLGAAGNTRSPLLYLSIAGALNVALNLLFVVGFHWDVAGVALASILSQYLSAALIVRALCRQTDSYRLTWRQLRITPEKARRILRMSLPAGAQNAIFALANLFIQAGVNTFDAVMVEGNSAAVNADGIVYDVMAAFYTACSSFMSQNLGAGKKERVMKSFLISLAFSFGFGAVLGGSLALFGRQFLSLFTTEQAVIDAGLYRLTIMGLSYAVSAFMDCTIAASRGLGRSFMPTVIVLLGSCVFRILWVYTVFAYFGTITSLYLLYIFSWTITGIAEIAYFRRAYRQVVG